MSRRSSPRVNKHPRPLPCICGKSYARADFFNDHIQSTGHGGKYVCVSQPLPDPVSDTCPFYCTCGQGFTATYAFHRHLRMRGHQGDWNRSRYLPVGHQSEPLAQASSDTEEHPVAAVGDDDPARSGEHTQSNNPPNGVRRLDHPAARGKILYDDEAAVEQVALQDYYSDNDHLPDFQGDALAPVHSPLTPPATDPTSPDGHTEDLEMLDYCSDDDLAAQQLLNEQEDARKYKIAKDKDLVNPFVLRNKEDNIHAPGSGPRNLNSGDVRRSNDLTDILDAQERINQTVRNDDRILKEMRRIPSAAALSRRPDTERTDGECEAAEHTAKNSHPGREEQYRRQVARRERRERRERRQGREPREPARSSIQRAVDAGVNHLRRILGRITHGLCNRKLRFLLLLAIGSLGYSARNTLSLPPAVHKHQWLLDSATPVHIARDSDLFSHVYPLVKTCVVQRFGLAEARHCDWFGTIEMEFGNGKKLLLHDTLYKPEAHANIVSMIKLGDAGLHGIWNGDNITITNATDNEFIGQASRLDERYWLEGVKRPQFWESSTKYEPSQKLDAYPEAIHSSTADFVSSTAPPPALTGQESISTATSHDAPVATSTHLATSMLIPSRHFTGYFNPPATTFITSYRAFTPSLVSTLSQATKSTEFPEPTNVLTASDVLEAPGTSNQTKLDIPTGHWETMESTPNTDTVGPPTYDGPITLTEPTITTKSSATTSKWDSTQTPPSFASTLQWPPGIILQNSDHLPSGDLQAPTPASNTTFLAPSTDYLPISSRKSWQVNGTEISEDSDLTKLRERSKDTRARLESFPQSSKRRGPPAKPRLRKPTRQHSNTTKTQVAQPSPSEPPFLKTTIGNTSFSITKPSTETPTAKPSASGSQITTKSNNSSSGVRSSKRTLPSDFDADIPASKKTCPAPSSVKPFGRTTFPAPSSCAAPLQTSSTAAVSTSIANDSSVLDELPPPSSSTSTWFGRFSWFGRTSRIDPQRYAIEALHKARNSAAESRHDISKDNSANSATDTMHEVGKDSGANSTTIEMYETGQGSDANSTADETHGIGKNSGAGITGLKECILKCFPRE